MYEGCLIAAAQRQGGACYHPVQLCLLGLLFFLLSEKKEENFFSSDSGSVIVKDAI